MTTTITTTSTGWYNEVFLLSFFLLSINFWFLSRSFWWFDISLAFNVLVNHLNASLWTILIWIKCFYFHLFSAFKDGDNRKLWFNKWIKFESLYSMIESPHTHAPPPSMYPFIYRTPIYMHRISVSVSHWNFICCRTPFMVGIVCLCPCVHVYIRLYALFSSSAFIYSSRVHRT